MPMFEMIAQLQAEPVMLMSVVKPVLLLMLMVPWAWLAGRLDKDAGYYYLAQNWWGLAHVTAGLLALVILLAIPIFWVAWPIAALLLAGEVFGYVVYRNKKVSKDEQWSGLEMLRKVQEGQQKKADEKARVHANVKLFSKDEAQLDVPHGSDPRTPAYDLFEKMLVFAVELGSDRLEMTIDSEKAAFQVRIDGIRYKQEAPPPELGLQLIQYLKENAGMDPEEHRRKQSGKLWVEVDDGDRNELALMTSGSTRVRQLIIDIDPEGRNNIALDDLGLINPAQLQTVQNLTKELSHVVLLASPPQQGTTTTFYSLLQEHDPYTSSVVTFEEETAFMVEGVSHNLFPANASNEQVLEKFGSLLRADPNVVAVSRLVSTEMAKTVAQYAEDTRFYVPLPAKDTMAALKLWIKVVGDQRQAAESLGAIISQRLVRKLCMLCRAPYHPDDAAIKKLNLSKAKFDHLYKASGKIMLKDEQVPCSMCHGLGYRGRIAVFEVMAIDREARSLIASGEGERLRAHFRKQKMDYLQEAALAKVVEGVCDIKEITRVMSESKKD